MILNRLRPTPLLALLAGLAASSACFAESPATRSFFWQEPQATVTETGDLEWAPTAFAYEPGPEVRYIDYEGGSDDNSGESPDAPWRHHPWDPEAAGKSAESEGHLTYVFKRGVVYRGTLVADESGAPEQPIILTADPNWGQGEAAILGSMLIEGGWQRVNAADAPAIPDADSVWFIDIEGDFVPRAVWQVDDEIRRVPVARTPNWTFSNPDDFKAEWYEWESVDTGAPPGSDITMNKASDPQHLSGESVEGATVWSEWIAVMGTPHGAKVESHDPETGTVYFTGFFENTNRMEASNRYFLEDLPQFLDTDGEYYYERRGEHGGRLYVRLHGDVDPNSTQVEVGRHLASVDLKGHSNIRISGLTFRFSNMYDYTVRPRFDPEVQSAAVMSLGSGKNIKIDHNTFEHLAQAIFLKAYGDQDVMDRIEITDNDIRDTDHGAITIDDGTHFFRQLAGKGELGHVRILRNRMQDIGFRPERKYHGHALFVNFPETAEIAGNFLERTAGAGIFVFGGKGSGQLGERPFGRILIYQNKVIDPLLNTNDWGGIETWQGGPTYVYNNISGNPGGYWHWKHVRSQEWGRRDHTSARFGFAYYLDGAFKNYIFNNVAWGKSSDMDSPLLNSAAFQEIHGFQNTYFNNTSFRFAAGMRRQAPEAGRNLYLGNIWMDISEVVFRHADGARDNPQANAEHVGRVGDNFSYETLAYAGNIVQATPQTFGIFDSSGTRYRSLEDFSEALESRGALASETGTMVETSPVVDAENHVFRLTEGSPAIDQGGRVFVPWALSGVVGEWHFLRNNQDPSVIFDEAWYMANYFIGREKYHDIPHFNLEIVNPSADAFVEGNLEDWTDGALMFDGNRYGRLSHQSITTDIPYTIGGKEYQYPGALVPSVEMQENSFILELVFKTEPGHTGGLLVGKAANSGYKLFINEDGQPQLDIFYDSQRVAARSGSHAVNDGEWHHLLVEVDRDVIHPKNQPVTIYLDGKKANGEWHGIMPTKYIQFVNTADFLVGGGPEETGFMGAMDFLRVSRGTLRDAKTTIEELYAWQFDGPQFRDFAGNPVTGERRDSGAFEYVPASGSE